MRPIEQLAPKFAMAILAIDLLQRIPGSFEKTKAPQMMTAVIFLRAIKVFDDSL